MYLRRICTDFTNICCVAGNIIRVRRRGVEIGAGTGPRNVLCGGLVTTGVDGDFFWRHMMG